MSIKTSISSIPTTKHPQFPCLRKWIGRGSATGTPIVVLFTAETGGVRLTGDITSLIGHSDTWVNCNHEDWEPCSITLTSET